MIKKHVNLLGKKGRDRITGTEGIITSVSFDLYGCVQAIITTQDESKESNYWRDVCRIEITDPDRALPLPSFDPTPEQIASGGKGPAMKPSK